MANLVVTAVAESFVVDMGAYYPSQTPTQKSSFNKWIISFHLQNNVIKVDIVGQSSWLVSHDGAGGSFIIDSVAGVAPANISDLFDKLVALV